MQAPVFPSIPDSSGVRNNLAGLTTPDVGTPPAATGRGAGLLQARPWLIPFAVSLALHVALAAVLFAGTARANVADSLRDEKGDSIALGAARGTLNVALRTFAASAPVRKADSRPAPRQPASAPLPAATPTVSSAEPANDTTAPSPAAPAQNQTDTDDTGSLRDNDSRTATETTAEPATAGNGQKGGAVTYFGKLRAWLNLHKKYPVAAKKEKQQGTVTVTFTIDRNGRLQASRIEQSSGHPLLDRAALELLRASSPMPRIPDSLGQEQLAITLPIEYSLITR